MKNSSIILLALLMTLVNYSYSQTTHFVLKSPYQIDVWSPYSYSSYNNSTNLILMDACKDVTFSLKPQTPVNGKNYSLYTDAGVFIKNSSNAYQIFSIPSGNYIVKDGSVEVVKVNITTIDRNTLFKLIITDNNYNEITDTSSTFLNSTTLRTTIKKLDNDSINLCLNSYANWRVNDVSFSVQPIFKEGDKICVLVDGTEECTKGCFSYNETCLIVGPSITTSTKYTEMNLKEFNISSNQFSDYTVMSFNSNDNYKVIINDLQGRTLKEFNNIYDKSITITRDNMKSGIYFYTVMNKINNTIYNGKLIIIE